VSQPPVIVVNSHVVRGSVGGRSSVFALQRLGFPVWSLTTVSLGWHPGHGRSTRIAPDDTAFAAAVGDLAHSPALSGVGAILVGYLGSEGQVEPLAELVAALKTMNPTAPFLYDPDIGDNGTLFVSAALAAKARDHLLPLADITTPNRFELGWLTGTTPETEAEVIAAARKLGPREVVVTSALASPAEITSILYADGAAQRATHPAAAKTPKGTGDLFAALYLARRLLGHSAGAALAGAAGAVAHLAEQAAAAGDDELPLAARQDAFLIEGTAVELTPVR
jgi:pyridoxine kinase